MVARTLIPPLLTPLLADEQVDRPSINRMVDRLLDSGADGVFVLGSSGEGPLLTPYQRRDVVEAAAEALRGRAQLFVGVSDCSAGRVRETMQHLTMPDVAAFVCTVPFYGVFDDPELQVTFFQALADAAPRPLLLYNIPQAVHATIEPATVARLASHPNIIGIKDSAGDMTRFQQLLALRASNTAFAVYQGAEQVAGLSLLAGASGLVVGLGNLAPSWFRDLIDAADAEDLPRLQQIQARISDLWRLHSAGHWLSCVKTAASLLGLCGPTVSAPIPRLSAAATERVRAILEAHELM